MRLEGGQEVALRDFSRSRAFGATLRADGQSCWIAILHTYWPMPGYLHYGEESPVYVEYCCSVYIRRCLKASFNIE